MSSSPSLRDKLQRQSNAHCHPHVPLTTATVVCTTSAQPLPDLLLSSISSFVTSKRWTIEPASEMGGYELLLRVVAFENAFGRKDPLYRSHVFSRAMMLAVKHDNTLELVACLHAYCPNGYAHRGCWKRRAWAKCP